MKVCQRRRWDPPRQSTERAPRGPPGFLVGRPRRRRAAHGTRSFQQRATTTRLLLFSFVFFVIPHPLVNGSPARSPVLHAQAARLRRRQPPRQSTDSLGTWKSLGHPAPGGVLPKHQKEQPARGRHHALVDVHHTCADGWEDAGDEVERGGRRPRNSPRCRAESARGAAADGHENCGGARRQVLETARVRVRHPAALLERRRPAAPLFVRDNGPALLRRRLEHASAEPEPAEWPGSSQLLRVNLA